MFRKSSPPCNAIWISIARNFCVCDAESRRVFLVESGILSFRIQNSALEMLNPPTIGIQNPSSTDKEIVNPRIWNPQGGIHNHRLSWMTLHGTKEPFSYHAVLGSSCQTVNANKVCVVNIKQLCNRSFRIIHINTSLGKQELKTPLVNNFIFISNKAEFVCNDSNCKLKTITIHTWKTYRIMQKTYTVKPRYNEGPRD